MVSKFDKRFPQYLGSWKRSVPGIHKDIAQDDLDEPHVKRRLNILEKHPEIKELYGVETKSIPITIVSTAVQLAVAYYFGRVSDSLFWLLVTSYVFGGTITQLYGVLIHEAAHGLTHSSQLVNRITGLIANICIPFPIACSFRRYHLEHHAFQGVEGKDPDLPLKWEIKMVKGSSFKKLLFLFFYPLMYVVRGLAMQKVPSTWEIINVIFTIVCDVLIYNVCGPRGLFYVFCSLWFGYGLHPSAMHFIQEHFTITDGQETYSYYGKMNFLYLNIGFHNEHHDFTKVPWSRIQKVKEIASEYYASLASHSSWTKLLFDFILNPQLGPQSRVGRTYEAHKTGRKGILTSKPEKMEKSDSGLTLDN